MQIKAGIKGELAEEYLYEFVNSNRGLSIYELSERLGWNAEEVHSLVKRLEEGGLIRTNESEKMGRLKRKVYPVKWKDLLPEYVKKGFWGRSLILLIWINDQYFIASMGVSYRCLSNVENHTSCKS